jgi:Phage terminase large subunit (GpA)
MDIYDGSDAIERAWCDGLKPDPLLTVSEWADRYRVLSQGASSEPGRWRTARTPYLKEIMDCLAPSSPVQRVVFMKGSQTRGHGGRQWMDWLRQLRLAPTGHVVGIDMNTALRVGAARGCDLAVLSELLPAAEAGLVDALSMDRGRRDGL